MDSEEVRQTDLYSLSDSDARASFRAKGSPDLLCFHSSGHPFSCERHMDNVTSIGRCDGRMVG